ncbi:ATP-binding protein [Thermococcus sp. GR7]|nr:ATP-binding protein [Thermococcus sp. LS1]NJE45904.1 ATP-binding protein [Thermococcus sp. GR7]NJE78795.1 ATP-binding protein [Thermococcus sp. GR4]NJF22099.1 ATP-binding protein [Thermococcus sp. GR5]
MKPYVVKAMGCQKPNYFSTAPKTRVCDLFGRDYHVHKFERWMLNPNRRFFIITGPRRVGKTSFLYSTLNELHKSKNYQTIVIDVRKVISMNKNYPEKPISQKMTGLLSGKKRFKEIFPFAKITVKLPFIEVAWENKEELSLAEIFDALGETDHTFVIAFDEAQELRYGQNDLRELFASVLDSPELQNIKLIFTGSQVGILEKWLAVDDGDSPLYGRFEKRIHLNRFSPNETIRFLEEGFEQNEFDDYDFDELILAYDEVGGTPGWLIDYANDRLEGYTHRKALKNMIEKAKRNVISEFKQLRKDKKKESNYEKVMRVIAKKVHERGYATFGEIKNYMGLNDSTVRELLIKLEDYGYIEQVGHNRYTIFDPIVVNVFIDV